MTHCGMHGVMEAIYHGVPMVGMPVFIDQVGSQCGSDLLAFTVSLPKINNMKTTTSIEIWNFNWLWNVLFIR